MLKPLLILCALIWLPILLHQITRQSFFILLIWLLIGPVASNLISRPGANPFFESPGQRSDWVALVTGYELQANAYLTGAATITVFELLEPTRALLAMFLVVFILDIFQKRRPWCPMDRTETWMGIFSVLLVASALFQSNRLAFGLRTVADAFAIPFLAYFFGRRLVSSEDRFRKLTQVIGYMGFYLIIIGLMERLAHSSLFYRLKGPFYGTNALYVTMAVVFFTVLMDFAVSSSHPEKKPALPRSIRWFTLFLAPLIIALNLTRGDWLGFFIGLCTFLLLARRLLKPTRKLVLAGAALILIPALVLGIQASLPEELMKSRVGDSANVYGRYATWTAALQGGTEHPIFGLGLNNLRTFLVQANIKVNKVGNYSTVHNSFLSIFVELGVVGMLAYLAIIASIMRMGLRLYQRGQHYYDRWRGATVIAIMLAYLTPAMFGNTLYIDTPLMHVYVYVVVGAIAGLYSQRQSIPALYVSREDSWRNSATLQASTR
jgi:O-antigen ligase